jgi:hypothetical protein
MTLKTICCITILGEIITVISIFLSKSNSWIFVPVFVIGLGIVCYSIHLFHKNGFLKN